MKTKDLDYFLPQNLIAQSPIRPRDHSRLLVLNRGGKTIVSTYFYNLPKYLKSTDVLVFNNTKVIPARLFGKKETGGKVEVLLLKKNDKYTWETLTKPRLKLNQKILFEKNLTAKVQKINSQVTSFLAFNKTGSSFEKILYSIGKAPTPPYIKKPVKKPSDYQTVYAKYKGSVAAPTAGFHFTKRLFENLRKKGIICKFLTLHVGLGTFQPIKEKTIESHQMHSEWFTISKKVANQLNKFKEENKRIIAVGTTTTRALESAVNRNGNLSFFKGETSLFIYPGYKFKFIDGLITNFHLPKSTLLALVCTFAGKDFAFKAYKEAIEKKYRFYSFGDGMLII